MAGINDVVREHLVVTLHHSYLGAVCVNSSRKLELTPTAGQDDDTENTHISLAEVCQASDSSAVVRLPILVW